ncbi:heterokaryon incompatibility protein-domain-containing protein [Echria macrotheca]|uniref:Heterokaryon incompatibility protein-domain-containing protein n=1 Tax=Echria macrotheca TaxID=438768 RepID=A0AAJ0BKG7_9PEZI|nr:heterokaryon incompatibility protein-domain-containing protein [Echria macrotheca]
MEADSSICKLCRSLDFSKALDALEQGTLGDQDAGLVLLQFKFSHDPFDANCPSCSLIRKAYAFIRPEKGEDVRLIACSYLQAVEGIDPSVNLPGPYKPKDSVVLLLAGDGGVIPGFCTDVGYTVCRRAHEVEPAFLRPQLVPPLFDAGKARLWITNCEECHGNGCKKVPLGTSIPGMLLIDCEADKVVGADPSMRWVVLSYRWATPSHTGHSSHDISQATATVKDAMSAVKAIGYRYLWVDKHCIDQLDAENQADQINKMDLIYNNAELVIIAAAGLDEHHGLPGVGSTPRVTKQGIVQVGQVTLLDMGIDAVSYVNLRSEWRKRAWTFQEGVLPRRRLIFTDQMSVFECQTGTWRESLGSVECLQEEHTAPVPGTKPLLLQPFRAALDQTFPPGTPAEVAVCEQMQKFMILVQGYTTRHLTFASDSLRAVTGILQFMSRHPDYPVFHFRGLPYPRLEESYAHFAELYFFISLSWYHTGYLPGPTRSGRHSVVPRRPQFPSWTWAGWAGGVRWEGFERSFHEPVRDVVCRMRNPCLESDTGRIFPVVDYITRGRLPEPRLEPVVAISFEAPVVPERIFRFPDHGEENWAAQKDWKWDPQMDRWRNIRIGTRSLPIARGFGLFPTDRPSEFVQRLQKKMWSCLWVGDHVSILPWDSQSSGGLTFLLIVEWQQDGSATRVGSLGIACPHDNDGKPVPLLEEGETTYMKVRLV